jgi:peroxiredoxin
MIALLIALSLQDAELPAGHSLHGEAFNEGPRQRAYLIPGMGDVVRFPVTTKSPEAQRFVNQGVAQLHSFYYFEAERSFRQAAALDPDLALAYWGMAMANVNNEKRAKEFLGQAERRRSGASKREQMWIDVLAKHYKETDKEKKARAQVKAIEAIVAEFPDDLEARAFLAWSLWYFKDKGLPIQSHVAVDSLIDAVLAKAPMHPGGHHYRIHLWDDEKAARALSSAPLYGPSAHGIAHAWHMPGHLYSKLQRYADAAWQQEASSRVDHAQMIRDRTMPYQIHNYVHNQQWCVTDLRHIGRAREALALAENLIEIPRHPKLNKIDSNGHACREGRAKIVDVCSTWELWDEILARKDGALAPIANAEDQARRLRALGSAYAERGLQEGARACAAELEALARDEKDEKKKKPLEGARAEVLARLALAAGDAAGAKEWLAKAEGSKSALALLWLRAGDKDKADKASQEGLNGAKGQLQPLAARVEVLRALGKPDEPGLAELAKYADADLPILKRLRVPAPSPRPAPEAAKAAKIETLGPLLWTPPPAADFTLDGFTLSKRLDRPVVLVFYLGAACAHCREQLAKFAELKDAWDAAGLRVVAISTESAEALRRSCDEGKINAPFTMLADPAGKVFREYRCRDDFENAPLHGTFLIDAGPDGAPRIRWQEISYGPFMEPKFLLEEAGRLTAK